METTRAHGLPLSCLNADCGPRWNSSWSRRALLCRCDRLLAGNLGGEVKAGWKPPSLAAAAGAAGAADVDVVVVVVAVAGDDADEDI